MVKLNGIGVALITPFKRNRKIDFKSIEKILNYLLNEINYLVILGTTGENSTLNYEEKIDIIQCINSIVNNKIPFVLGIGGNNTEDVIRQINQIDISSFEAILSVSPYYNLPSQEGIYNHFKKISLETQANLIIYNIPNRTGINVLPETIIRLAKNFKNIVAVKESSGNLAQAYKIIKYQPYNFSVISGDDYLCLPIILGGGNGVISVLAQGVP
jgi:4-hydroxy-tetrahydrodipicolinate synthase